MCGSYIKLKALALILLFTQLQSCASTTTFPGIARQGDTISVMVAGSNRVKKETISVVLTDAVGAEWDLSTMGLVRSVFNLRPDGRAEGMHYSAYFDTFLPWAFGHEPVQTVLIADLPNSNVAPGNASLTIGVLETDNSAGAAYPITVQLEIIAGQGQQELFPVQGPGGESMDFSRLEPAPYMELNFAACTENIGAASIIINFDETVVNPDDINVYSPESTVRGTAITSGAFGETQRMIFWHNDGQNLLIDIVAPQGIKPLFLQLFAMHPSSVIGNPSFALTSSDVYDVNGDKTSCTPTLEYFP